MTDELMRSGGLRAVHLEREYPTAAEDLWETWTDPQRLARWLGTPAGPIVGAEAPVRISMGEQDDEWVDVAILTADRPRLLEMSWAFVGEAPGRLRVEFVPIAPDRTRLVLDHSGLAESSTGYGAGWQAFLDGPLARQFQPEQTEGWDDLFARAMPVWRQRAAELG